MRTFVQPQVASKPANVFGVFKQPSVTPAQPAPFMVPSVQTALQVSAPTPTTVAKIAPATSPWGGGCPWQCDKSRFKEWCKAACDNPDGSERKEMYGFLAECFLDADGDRDGKISPEEFDFLVEKAASLPRRFGLAPSWVEAYGDIQTRMQARNQMFLDMNVDRSGKIGLSEWVGFAIKHITGKVRIMDDVLDFQNLEKRAPEELVEYCKTAVSDQSSEHYKSLYAHLFKTFVESDVEENGAIRREQFDILIECAAKAPRVVGLAPSTEETYASETEKVAARDSMFRTMDSDGTGLITFEKFLAWCTVHVAGKVGVQGKGSQSPWGGGCPWQCEKTSFKKWCKASIENPSGSERKEMYGFLAECFLDADGDRDGKISPEEFDFLVEKAASLPRRFGLAPSWVEAYGDIQSRMQARNQMFLDMNVNKSGKIGLSEWVRFAIAHIAGKVSIMDDVLDFQRLERRGPQEMVRYCEVAVLNSKSEQYKSLYEHLFKTFVESDLEQKGAIPREKFDELIECAAKAPRVAGLAPSTAATYATEAAKTAARNSMFQEMDTDRTRLITFEKFLQWSLVHIAGKVESYNASQSPWGGGCPWQSEKTEFKRFCTAAIAKSDSSERKELYGFLAECFLDADGDRDGRIAPEEFDFLVEKAASLPRRFGMAPSWQEAYGSLQSRLNARNQMFMSMNADRTGKIGLEEWINFAIAHITEKVKTIDNVLDFNKLENRGQDEMVNYCDVAVSNPKSEHYKSLYEHLFKVFVESDIEENGAIRREQFDVLIEAAGKAPRAVGLAPTTPETYATDTAKKMARDQMFRTMDTNRSGFITFEKFLNWAVEHVAGKVRAYKSGQGYKKPMGVSDKKAAPKPKWTPPKLSAVTVQSDSPWGGGCPWQSEKTAFKRFCKASIENPNGSQRKELYGFLAECFLDADGDRDGRISLEEFDFMVEKAASLPRRFGLAPSWQEAYGNVQQRMQARQQMFMAMNADRTGKIGLEEWTKFAIAHITEKVNVMDDVMDFQRLENRGKDEMVNYCAIAVSNPQSEHYKSLYEHLFKTFVESDVEVKGSIRRDQFDILIECAAKAPRVVGLAPSTSQTYATEAMKKMARDKMFQEMDTNRSGLVTFEKFLIWSVRHIAGKVNTYKR